MKGYHSEETKKKISESKKRNPTRYWLGKKHSPETIAKITATKKANPTRYWLGKKRAKFSEEWKSKIIKNLRHEKGVEFNDEHKKNLSLAHIGQKAWNKGIPNLSTKGEKNWNWKGGITPENKKIRMSIEYRLWREAVFERDDYTCVECGLRGVYLNADHIKPFSLFPELRLDINNGRTLCKTCHYKIGWCLFREANPQQVTA